MSMEKKKSSFLVSEGMIFFKCV